METLSSWHHSETVTSTRVGQAHSDTSIQLSVEYYTLFNVCSFLNQSELFVLRPCLSHVPRLSYFSKIGKCIFFLEFK